MTTLPNFALPLPTRGRPGAGQWADKIDAWLRKIDEHTHEPGFGVAIPTGGINLDADLTFSSTFAPIDLHRIQFARVDTLASGAQNLSLFVDTNDDELYFRNTSGNHIQITDGNVLNVAAFIGGIGGDYTAVGALLDYDDATLTYRLRQELGASVRQYARIAAGSIDLFEHKVHPATPPPTFRVRLSSPAALAAPYEVTFPAAVPAATSIVQMSSAGVLTASNTVVNSVTLAADKSVTVSGTGDFKHGSMTLQLSTVGAVIMSGTATRGNDGSITSTASATLGWELPFKTGDRVTSLTINGFGDGAIDPVINLNRNVAGTTSVYATATATNAPASSVDTTITPGSPSALGADDNLWLQVVCNAGSFTVARIRVVYDRP